ncbi:hydroxypyruvate reductase [Sulfurifustis variabilis]|uniref:Hydroxypyruvate reductase n=1 Tax=Sulfurifustis variabilis TaxID=1675686 RepID=A0A1B4V1E2_9GAMM|nr:DUF4147 domain-containing protein [Sulfurifustis variabilis]BAU47306.1 hydroxypyruvate reductase [Sulfurifustis variabilis]
MALDPRRALLEIFEAAVSAVNGARRVREFLQAHPPAGPVHLIAVGKAACPMARGAAEALGDGVRRGLVITKHGYAEPLPWPVLPAGHPVPDSASLAAGDRLLEYIKELPPDASVLVLLSGGASALVERLPEGAGLEHLRSLNEWILASGRDISAANRIRKRLSLIKGGRLAALLSPRKTLCLAVSDVPGDDPRYIGSGPLVADASIGQEPIDDAPPELRALLEHAPPVPVEGDPVFTGVRFEIVARPEDAKQAAARAARERGLAVTCEAEPLAGDALAAGARLATRLLQSGPRRVHVWGGETTVRLPYAPGRGGRNQSLALAAAVVLRGHPHSFLLAAGTDGTDGPTDDAGALVDGETITRGEAAGLSASGALARADAGTFLEASGDLIRTGPTGTNVMDLVLGLRLPP